MGYCYWCVCLNSFLFSFQNVGSKTFWKSSLYLIVKKKVLISLLQRMMMMIIIIIIIIIIMMMMMMMMIMMMMIMMIVAMIIITITTIIIKMVFYMNSKFQKIKQVLKIICLSNWKDKLSDANQKCFILNK